MKTEKSKFVKLGVLGKILLTAGLLSSVILHAEDNTTISENLNNTYDRTLNDAGYSITTTSDGGYAVAGQANDYTWTRAWVIKLDEEGNQEWESTFEDTSSALGFSIIEISEGGYVVAGKNSRVAWVAKLDSNGNKIWDKTYTGTYEIRSILQTSDGGYIAAGTSQTTEDFSIIKLDADGNMVWNKTYGGSLIEHADQIVITSDGGYAIAGMTRSFGAGASDGWLVKLDSDGNKEWDKTFGGIDMDDFYSMAHTIDGGYITAGRTYSIGNGNVDFWVVKVDADGNKVWENAYGGSEGEIANSVIQTSDGGYAVAGLENSFGADAANGWVVKLGNDGSKEWDKTFGSSDISRFLSIVEVEEGSYAATGFTRNLVSDTSNDVQNSDIWVVAFTALEDTTPPVFTGLPEDKTIEATSLLTNVELGNVVATDSSGDVTMTNDAPESGFTLGATTVTWTATDEAGNSTTETQVITVQDTTAPVLIAPEDVTITGNKTLNVVDFGTATATDIFEPVTITNDAPVEGFPRKATTVVTWTATDTNGNITTATQLVTMTNKK